MRTFAYLLIDSHGAIEIRKKPPEPHLRQVAIKLSIQIDDSWFVRAIPTIDLIVPNDHVQPMAEIQIEPITNDSSEALQPSQEALDSPESDTSTA